MTRIVKNVEEILSILKEDGYIEDEKGNWLKLNNLVFTKQMFEFCDTKMKTTYCGKTQENQDMYTGNKYRWNDKWLCQHINTFTK